MGEDRLDEQYQTEIPRKPIVRKFNIHCGHCACCGKRMRGRHTLQTSDAAGAAQSQIGPEAQAAIVYLNKHAGLSYGKIADTFDKMFHIKVTRGRTHRSSCGRVGNSNRRTKRSRKRSSIRSIRRPTKRAGASNKNAPSWFAFVLDPETPATNHRGEQALRLPIVNRKVWGGNRTHAGAEAQEVTSSVLATCQKRKFNPFTFVSQALCGMLRSLFGSGGC